MGRLRAVRCTTTKQPFTENMNEINSMKDHSKITSQMGNMAAIEAELAQAAATHPLKRSLQDIYRTSECLEIQAREAVDSMNGRYGTEDTAYTHRRINDVLRVLRELEELHTELKWLMEGAVWLVPLTVTPI